MVVCSWPRTASCSSRGTLDEAATAPMFDGVGHLTAVGLGLGHGPGDGPRPFGVGELRHDRLEDAVGGGEGADHLLGSGFGGLAGERSHGGELPHGLVGQAR